MYIFPGSITGMLMFFTSDITGILPVLYSLLDTPFIVHSISAIVEVLTNSVFRDGKATKILTEPLLRWIAVRGTQIANQAIQGEPARWKVKSYLDSAFRRRGC